MNNGRGEIEKHWAKSPCLLMRFKFCIFSHRGKGKTQVAGEEEQATMGRIKKGGEAPVRSCVDFLAILLISWHGTILVFLSLGSAQF